MTSCMDLRTGHGSDSVHDIEGSSATTLLLRR
jgi:hypothetical protein